MLSALESPDLKNKHRSVSIDHLNVILPRVFNYILYFLYHYKVIKRKIETGSWGTMMQRLDKLYLKS